MFARHFLPTNKPRDVFPSHLQAQILNPMKKIKAVTLKRFDSIFPMYSGVLFKLFLFLYSQASQNKQCDVYIRVFVRVRSLWENRNLSSLNIIIYLHVKYNCIEFSILLKVVDSNWTFHAQMQIASRAYIYHFIADHFQMVGGRINQVLIPIYRYLLVWFILNVNEGERVCECESVK